MVAATDYRARVDTRPAVLSKNYAEIGFDACPSLDPIRRGQRIRRVARNRANDYSFIGETA